MFSLLWFTTLLLVGAAGGYLAQRADVPRKTRLVAATSPALLLGLLMLLLLPRRLAVEGHRWALIFFASEAETSVIIPGLALLLGALPFLWRPSANSFSMPEGDATASMGASPLPE